MSARKEKDSKFLCAGTMFSAFELMFSKFFVHISDVKFSIIKSKILVIENSCSNKKIILFCKLNHV